MTKEQLIAYWEANKLVTDKRVLGAFREVKRQDFVPESLKKLAYDDIPLPLTEGQTISQPTTVVMMLELLEVKKDSKVLEIGTGCGYNAALISKLTDKKIYTIERLEKLVEMAKENIAKAEIKNIKIILGDGSKGYPKEAPYDRIIATCACTEIPKAWKEQLKEGGIIVAPVGEASQTMIVARKINGEFTYSKHGGFSFVPLVKD